MTTKLKTENMQVLLRRDDVNDIHAELYLLDLLFHGVQHCPREPLGSLSSKQAFSVLQISECPSDGTAKQWWRQRQRKVWKACTIKSTPSARPSKGMALHEFFFTWQLSCRRYFPASSGHCGWNGSSLCLAALERWEQSHTQGCTRGSRWPPRPKRVLQVCKQTNVRVEKEEETVDMQNGMGHDDSVSMK
jgi:hypothetical protein